MTPPNELALESPTPLGSPESYSEVVTMVRPSVGVLPDAPPALGEIGPGEPRTEAVEGPMPLVPPGVRFPEVGEEYLGFDLVAELGQGAMGRVYLAQQLGLARRSVVLKVGISLSAESQKLARLEHPNIVPIHSFHRDGPLQAVCMPYRGPLTLAHVVARLQVENLPTLSGRALGTVISQCRQLRVRVVDPTAPGPAAAAPARPAIAQPPEWSTKPSYVDAVLTIGRDLAAGLAFAHRHSIVHSDLKPANVLIGDDGRPLLIDFSIAYDRTALARGALRLGGTRPYMSPEQIHAFRIRRPEFDERSDLYALGVILYELLTGRLPYEGTPDTSFAALARDLAARFQPPPRVRSLNPKVPLAVESIVRKCLAPDEPSRYQTAEQLHEDLTRQLARRPLRFAPNPSDRELAGKWARRNRWALVGALALAAAGAGAAGFAEYDARRGREVARLEFLGAADATAADLREAEFALIQDGDPMLRDRGRVAAHRVLGRYRAYDDGWYARPGVDELPPAVLGPTRETVSGLMLLLADSFAREAMRSPAGPVRDDWFRQAAEWNRRAERCHPDPGGCRAVWIQRSALARRTGDPVEGERLAARAAAMPRSTTHESVLEARQLMSEGCSHTARQLLKETTDRDPQTFWGWFYLGQSSDAVAEYREALTAYDIAATHQPGFFGTYFNRGLVKIRLRDAAGAEADFDRVVAARPEWADGYLNRAVARESRRRYAEALADLDRAVELGYPTTAVLLVRARVHDKRGDKAAAARDLAAALKTDPTDERGWLARGMARMTTDPAAAATDFAQVLQLNPDSRAALQATAHVLARQGKTREASEALTRLIAVSPDSPDAWSGRGVLYARLNDRDAAVADAKEAVRLSNHPRTLYQVAGIYALSSRTHSEDRREALALLSAALRGGFGFEHLDGDKELDPLRKDPEFRRTVDAARAHRASREGSN
jgi:serine/threonine protein kinase/tetratricopeptide (TPR) repeat protein